MINQIISKLNSLRFAVTEPRRVRRERKKNEWKYQHCIAYPTIEIYTPTYNRCQLLIDRAFKSVFFQTYSGWEWWVIDDCSTDNTPEVMEKVCQYHPRVHYIRMPPYTKRHPLDAQTMWFCGPIYAANEALEHLNQGIGRWIAVIDDDDVWHKDHLKDTLAFAMKNNLEFASAWNEEVREGVHKIVKDDPATPGIGARATWVYRSYLSFMKYNVNCYRKRVNRVNDTDLAERMIKAGVRIGQIPAVHAYSIPRPGESNIGLKAYKEAEQKGYQVHNGAAGRAP